MKIFKNILRFCAATILSLSFAGCQEAELVKPSALMSDPSLTFAATGAEPQTFTVASDDYWMIDVAESWLAVEPLSGTGTMEVTVTVTDNATNDVVNAPRETTLTIADKKGYSVKTTIYQNGDNYLGVSEMPISSVVALEDGEFAKVAEAQVVALTAEGFVATDATGAIYVTARAEVAVGDKVFLAGEKSTLYGNPVLKAGDVNVNSNGEVTYPAPVDLATNLDPANANKIVYVSTEAGLLGRTLNYEQAIPVSVTLLDPKAGVLDLEAVNMHNIVIEAYFIGIEKGDVKLAVTKVEDKGVNENLKAYLYDDFSWMKSFIEESGQKVGDSVGEDNPSADAPNLKTSAPLALLMDEFYARGYEDLNPDAKVIYPQAYYWKFGKTSNHGGLKLPQLELQGAELINIDVEFDWSPHMTGSGNIDKVSVVVEIEGSGSFDNGTKISDVFVNECQKGDLKWHHVNAMVKGANNTTRIMIRPYQFAEATPDQQRFHLDNVKVSDSDIPYSDPVYAKVSLSDEIVTFEGVPAGPYEIKINSDNPWTLTKGVDSDWFDLDVTEGPAGEETVVKVTCQSSTVSTLRKSTITLASADTRKTIHVVQSAAGGELAPLISIVGGNKGNVGFDAGSFNLGVQANVAYEFESDASWVTVEAVPATKAIVETTELLVSYEANTAETPRTAKIKVFNTLDNLEAVYTLTQAPFESGIYYSEDFTWVAPWADVYGSGDSVGDDNASGKAPNVYTQASHQEYDGVGYANGGAGVEGYPSFLAEYASRGYEDVNPSVTSFYTQKYYLKFGATSKHTGIRLPAIEAVGAEATDAVLSFDWSAHMTGSGNIDKLQLVVELEGDGVCADSRAKVSNLIYHTQEKGDLKWQNVKILLKGITSSTRIVIRPSLLDDSDGVTQKRWHLDNIKLAKPKPTVLAAWDLSSEGMKTYADTWGGVDPGTYDKNAGDGGKFIAANAAGNGKLTYVQIDKNEIDVNNKARRICGGTGEPYVEGQWVGDSWNLTAEAAVPAGSLVGASFASRASGTGLKYWIVEYLDGDTWKPALPTKTVEVGGQTITYNVEHMNTTEFKIEFVVSTTVDMSTFHIRETCLSNAQAKAGDLLEAPNGGTMRLKGADLSPKIVMF